VRPALVRAGGVARDASNRVIRGGNFNNDASNLRGANRNNDTPTNRNNNIGVRCAKTVGFLVEDIQSRRDYGRGGRDAP
jgi:formylglycine-generating enzyme required for sulfatase activity